ncbi:MAG: hypothetical protein JSR34_12795 [Proteobacteria bacterium]|nr:hypothetical protein [Pseudomonadota bacterium]
MRTPWIAPMLAPLLLVSCSCSQRPAAPAAAAASSTPARQIGTAHAAPSTSAPLPVAAIDASDPAHATDAAPAAAGQTLRIALVDARTRQPVYHAGLTLAGATTLQWTDRQGRYDWIGGFPIRGAIEIRCPALRAEVGRKLKTVSYVAQGQLTALDTSIDAGTCAEPPERTSGGMFAGTLFPYYGHGAFIPCGGMPADATFYGNAKAAWVNMSVAATAQYNAARKTAGIDAATDKPMHVEWSGRLIGPGGYGLQGAFAYRLDVDAVGKVTAGFTDDCPAASLQ